MFFRTIRHFRTEKSKVSRGNFLGLLLRTGKKIWPIADRSVLVMIPEVFARANSAQVPSRFLKGKWM